MGATTMTTGRTRRIGDLGLRGLLTAVFLVAAGMKFAAVPFEVAGFARFGYAAWFMYLVGALQLGGAVLLWTRGIACGAALLAVLMAGAVFSHLRAGDPVAMMVPAAVLFVLLCGLALARRGDLVRGLPRMRSARA